MNKITKIFLMLSLIFVSISSVSLFSNFQVNCAIGVAYSGGGCCCFFLNRSVHYYSRVADSRRLKTSIEKNKIDEATCISTHEKKRKVNNIAAVLIQDRN